MRLSPEVFTLQGASAMNKSMQSPDGSGRFCTPKTKPCWSAVDLLWVAVFGMSACGCYPDASQPVRSAAHFEKTKGEVVPEVKKEIEKLTALPIEQERQPDPALVTEVGRLFQDAPVTPLSDLRSPTRKDVYSSWVEWYQSVFLESYKQFGDRNPAWDEQALTFLEGFCENIDPGYTSPAFPRLIELGKELKTLECKDPLIQCLTVHLVMKDPRYDVFHDEFWDTARESARGFRQREYPPIVSWWGYMTEARRTARRYVVGSDPSLFTMLHQSLPLVISAASDENFSMVGRRMVMVQIDSAMEDVLNNRGAMFLEEWNRAPNVDPWIKNMVAAREHQRAAWRARGHGFAGSVTPEGWEGFQAHMERARVLLLEAWKLHPELPHAATDLISVTTAIGGIANETPRFWLDQAVKAQFDYSTPYSYFTNSLLPRWGGSHQEMLAFARECLATERFDTEVPWKYHELLTAIAAEVHSPRDVFQLPGVYEDYSKLLTGCQAHLDDDDVDQRRKYNSQLACVAWLNGQHDQARELLGALGHDVHPDVFAEFGVAFGEVRRALASDARSTPLDLSEVSESIVDVAFLGGARSLKFTTANDALFTVAGFEGAWLWELAPGCPRKYSLPLDESFRFLVADLSSDGTKIAYYASKSPEPPERGSVLLHDIGDGETRQVLMPPPGKVRWVGDDPLSQRNVRHVRFSPDGSMLACGCVFHAIVLVDVANGAVWPWGLLQEHETQGLISAIAYSSDGRVLASADSHRVVKIWDMPEDPEAQQNTILSRTSLRNFADTPECLCFSPDGTRLLVGHRVVEVWDLDEEKKLFDVPGEQAAYSPDGMTFVTAGGSLGTQARLWDASTGAEVQRFYGMHEDPVISVAFAPNGKRIVTSSFDKRQRRPGRVVCWDVETGLDVPDFSGLGGE
jgi:WD40 repeat protein